MTEHTFVIVGASVAGARAAEALREYGFDGRVVLVGDEAELPYERPPLSKGYLSGKDPKDKAYLHPEAWYGEQRIELLLGVRAESLDVGAHEIELSDSGRLRYDKALLATGSSVAPLRVPGADLAGLHYLRTFEESSRLRAALAHGGRVVIVGGGWIGLEVASAARGYGCDVVVVEPQPAPLFGVLGPELGEFYASVHRDHGVRLHLGVGVAELRGAGGVVDTVVTTDGERLAADVVVAGVGIRPNVELAQAAGLLVDDGIVTDEFLVTSDPDVYAAGDVANARNPLLGRHVRVQHWANANDQGPAAARSMLGQAEAYAKVPYFFSDQYDVGMEYSGVARPGDYDALVYRGDPAARDFCAFWLAESRVVAGMNVNVWDVHSDIRVLIKSGAVIDVQRLTDPAVALPDAVA